jgi:hypothetical protein
MVCSRKRKISSYGDIYSQPKTCPAMPVFDLIAIAMEHE